MPKFPLTEGALGASAWVVASNASAQIKAFAQILQASGYPVWQCDGIADNIEIQAAIDTCFAAGFGNVWIAPGNYAGIAGLYAKSNVNVSAYGATYTLTVTPGGGTPNGLNVASITNSIWEGIKVIVTGNREDQDARGCEITGTTDRTFILYRCKFTNQVTSTGSEKGAGLIIHSYVTASPTLIEVTAQGSPNVPGTDNGWGFDLRLLFDPITNILGKPKFIHCIGIGGGSVGVSAAFRLSEAQDSYFEDCRAYRPDGSNGLWYMNDASPTLVRCWGRFTMFCGASPKLFECVGIAERLSEYGFVVYDSSAPTLVNCIGGPLPELHQFDYVADNNGRFIPFSDKPYMVTNITVWVRTAAAGKTLNIGTTIGGNEIAANIPLDTVGHVNFTFTRQFLAAGAYLYATPSDPGATGNPQIYYDVMVAYNNSGGLLLGTMGAAVVKGGTFIAPQNAENYALAVRIEGLSLTYLNWRLENCHIESYGRFAIFAESAIVAAPIYNCSIFSAITPALKNITSLATMVGIKNSGAATGTGAEQLVAHGLSFTPTRQQIALTPGSAAAVPFHSSDPDGTNIKVTAGLNQPWYWATVGG